MPYFLNQFFKFNQQDYPGVFRRELIAIAVFLNNLIIRERKYDFITSDIYGLRAESNELRSRIKSPIVNAIYRDVIVKNIVNFRSTVNETDRVVAELTCRPSGTEYALK